MIAIQPHPLLDASVFVTRFPRPLGELPVPEWLLDFLRPGAHAPMTTNERIRTAVRDMLRVFGYKPTGRGKPSSEYLARAVEENRLASINLAVDAGNAVSLHSGLPISVVDLDRTRSPLSLLVAGAGMEYVFNPAGQIIDVEGLPCLFDADGPCANAVKDAQRTKTNEATRTTLSIVWGVRSLPECTTEAVAWYREMLARAGATTEDVPVMTAE